MKFDPVEVIQAKHPHTALVRFNFALKEITAVLLNASKKKKKKCWHAFGYLSVDLVQTWFDDRYY